MTSQTIPIPDRLKKFPLHLGKYPIFFTVAKDHDGHPVFAETDRIRQLECYNKFLCHICGQKLDVPFWLVLGPEEVKAKIFASNGPMHEECARYSIAACPFLANPDYVSKRNPFEDALAEGRYSVADSLLLHHGDSPNVRPPQIALCTADRYKILNPKGQIVDIQVPQWLTTDWDAIPQRKR